MVGKGRPREQLPFVQLYVVDCLSDACDLRTLAVSLPVGVGRFTSTVFLLVGSVIVELQQLCESAIDLLLVAVESGLARRGAWRIVLL
jgi:hypothetical protein